MGELYEEQGGTAGMGGKSRTSKAQLPIPTVRTAQALILMYGRLKGELAKAECGEAVIIPVRDAQEHMSRIIGLMPLLGFDFDPDEVKTVVTRVQVGPLEWGAMRTGILTVLRAGGDWMTYRQISDALLARNRRGSSLDVQAMSKFVQKVREALFFQLRAGTVEREREIPVGDSDRLQRFRLSTTKFRT